MMVLSNAMVLPNQLCAKLISLISFICCLLHNQ